jgi:DNA-binding FadR family transcriptional regulator
MPECSQAVTKFPLKGLDSAGARDLQSRILEEVNDGLFEGEERSGPGRSLTYELLETLGRAIVTGMYEVRPFPTELEIAREHGVSRSVVREAVKMLAAKGLVSARPRIGTTVEPSRNWNLFDPDVIGWLVERQFSLSLLHQFSELRLGLEPAAAEIMARNGSEESIVAVSAALDRMIAARQGADDPLEADVAFHVAILRGTDNLFYSQLHDLLAVPLRTSIRFTNRFLGKSADISRYVEVRDHISAGEPAKARNAMTLIIEDVIALLDRAIQASA